MPNDKLADVKWQMRAFKSGAQEVMTSNLYDDVYFSVDDGLAETRHVFLNGNDLPARMAVAKKLTIGELGFGTGLNFLALWQLQQQINPDCAVHFISVEKFPLARGDFLAAHQIFKTKYPELAVFSDQLCDVISAHEWRHGRNEFSFGNVKLDILYTDISDILNFWPDIKIDAWFLDGFSPAKNAEMWSSEVMENIATLSAPKASFASFTAAGFVRENLTQAGFTVDKVKGHGRKRHMIRGRLKAK